MIKLLQKFKLTPSIDNAKRVQSYYRQHPMCVCMLLPSELSTLADVSSMMKGAGK